LEVNQKTEGQEEKSVQNNFKLNEMQREEKSGEYTTRKQRKTGIFKA
jgi:hypothetical protein